MYDIRYAQCDIVKTLPSNRVKHCTSVTQHLAIDAACALGGGAVEEISRKVLALETGLRYELAAW